MHLLYLKDLIPVGYEALINLYALNVIPHFRRSYVTLKGSSKVIYEYHIEIHIYPKAYLPKDPDNAFLQLEFAFKYDGINLEILSALFKKIEVTLITDFIRSQPTGKNTRRLWYLYEFLTGKALEIEDAQGGSYVLLLDEDKYYTGSTIRSRRHYVDDNLLGNQEFCPIVRKTDLLKHYEALHLENIARDLIQQYDPLVLARAINYLYAKETMSSYEIERERPDKKRLTKFIELLKEAKFLTTLTKQSLIDLQNNIVDSRFADNDYRNYQNYIGEQRDWYRQTLHYIPPKPEDVSGLMQGLLDCFERMLHSSLNPIVIAAVVAFGFVFIHPFEDGNGRIHRFLIHYILSRLKYTPIDVIFPISATILKNMQEYDDVLESFSKPLLDLLKQYEFDEKGKLTVYGNNRSYYAYVDYTRMVEFLFACVEKTIKTDFQDELNYIVNYDRAKRAIQEIVDLPDRKINQFILFVSQNQGRLSLKKKEQYFDMLTDDEIKRMEEAVQEWINGS